MFSNFSRMVRNYSLNVGPASRITVHHSDVMSYFFLFVYFITEGRTLRAACLFSACLNSAVKERPVRSPT